MHQQKDLDQGSSGTRQPARFESFLPSNGQDTTGRYEHLSEKLASEPDSMKLSVGRMPAGDTLPANMPAADQLLAFADNDEGEAPEDDTPEKTGREKLLDALEQRNEPFAKEFKGLRDTIAKNDGFNKVWNNVTFNDGMVSIDIKDDKGESLRLSNTGNRDIYVVQKGDSTYIINRRTPELDTRVNAKDGPGEALDWSQDTTLRKEAENQHIVASTSLQQQMRRHRGKTDNSIGIQMLEGSLNLAEAAHAQGVLPDRDYARDLDFIGFSFDTTFGDPGKGARLKEKSIPVFERAFGSSDPETMSARASLASTYLDSGRTAQANTLLTRNLGSLAELERTGHGLDHDAVLERMTLKKQLDRASRKDDADKLNNNAYDLIVRNPSNVPLHETGITVQRNELIKDYMKDRGANHGKIDKLLDSAVSGVESLEKTDPDSSLINVERNDVITHLKNFGDKDRLNKVLTGKERQLDRDGSFAAANQERLSEERINLANDYLAAGNKDAALRVAESVLKRFDGKETKPEDVAKAIQSRLNLGSRLVGLADTPLMAKFREGTREQLANLEKSDVDKKWLWEASSSRTELINQFAEGKDYKGARDLVEQQLQFLEKPADQKGDSQAYQIPGMRLLKGEFEEKLNDDKNARQTYESLIKDTTDERSKVEPLGRLVKLYERSGDTEAAKKAKADLDLINKGAPPEHFKTVQRVNVAG